MYLYFVFSQPEQSLQNCCTILHHLGNGKFRTSSHNLKSSYLESGALCVRQKDSACKYCIVSGYKFYYKYIATYSIIGGLDNLCHLSSQVMSTCKDIQIFVLLAIMKKDQRNKKRGTGRHIPNGKCSLEPHI